MCVAFCVLNVLLRTFDSGAEFEHGLEVQIKHKKSLKGKQKNEEDIIEKKRKKTVECTRMADA